MHPQLETIRKGKLRLTELWTTYPYLSDIDKVKDTLNKKALDITPDQLSRAAFSLSMYLCNLGGLVSELTANANERYVFRKYRQMWEFHELSTKMTIKSRENIAFDNVFSEYSEALTAAFVADFMKSYKDDTERVVNVIQTRISYLKQEYFNSKNQV